MARRYWPDEASFMSLDREWIPLYAILRKMRELWPAINASSASRILAARRYFYADGRHILIVRRERLKKVRSQLGGLQP